MMFKIFKKIMDFIDWDHRRCYNEREDEGVAIFGLCSGLVGGSKETNHLQEDCVNCRYLHHDIQQYMEL